MEEILKNEDLSRSKKYSYETSLGHFLTIQLLLEELKLKKGGELQSTRKSPEHAIEEEKEEGEEGEGELTVKWGEVESAFKNRIRTGVISNVKHLDFDKFMADAKIIFETQIRRVLEEFNSVKVNTSLTAKYTIEKADLVEVDVKQFNTKNVSIYKSTNLSRVFEEDIRKPLDEEMEDFQEVGSGWSLQSLLHLTININKLNPMRAGCKIDLPVDIQKKHACVNVKNKDKKCFMWSVLAGIHKGFKNPQNESHYRHYVNTLNFNGIDFPVKVEDIPKFERQNECISVNVYILNRFGDKHEVAPLYLTSLKQENHVNLLLVKEFYPDEYGNIDCENDENQITAVPEYHYVVIRSLSRLVRSQLSNHKEKCYVCDRCLHYFWVEQKLKDHELECVLRNKCKIVLPKWKNRFLKFDNYCHKERVPTIIYADFECLITPREDEQIERIVANHKAFSIGYYVKYGYDFEGTSSKYESYRQQDETDMTPAEWFIEQLRAIVVKMEQIYKDIKPMRLTRNELEEYDSALWCHICGMPFDRKDPKVKDHCHLTGR